MGNFNEKENDDIYDDIFNEKKYFDIDKEIENNICCCFKNQRNYLEKVEIKRHNKFSKHNTINKINAFFINKYIIDLIKKNSSKNDISLKKLSPNFINKLNKRNIERLLDMKISDIFIEQDISSKYINYFKEYNKNLINKIYEEKKEIKVIKILELTFEELFIIFRRKLNVPNDINKLEEIKDKIKGLDLIEENNKYKDVEYLIQEIKSKDRYDSDYIDKFKQTCLDYLGYKKWFCVKNRNRNRNKNKNKYY